MEADQGKAPCAVVQPGLSSKKFYGPGVVSCSGLSMVPPRLAELAMAERGRTEDDSAGLRLAQSPAARIPMGKLIAFMAVGIGGACHVSLLFTYFGLTFAGDRAFMIATVLYAFCVGVVCNDGRVEHPQQAAGELTSRSSRRFLLVFLLSMA